MADENQANNAPTVEVAQTEQVAQGERTYSQAEVDRLLQAKHDSAFAEARRTLKPKRAEEAKSSKAQTDEKGSQPDSMARLLAQRDALDDVLADKHVTHEQRKFLRKQLEIADPDEPSAWLESFLSTFLGGGATNKSDTPNTSTKETSMPRQPGDHPGPAQSAPPWERPSDPFKWTAEDVARLEALKGPREAHRIIRQKAEAFARTMRIQMSPQRR